MKKTSTQKELLPDDVLTRFLFYKKTEINYNMHCIKSSVFSNKDNELSVYETTGLKHEKIWSIGKIEVANKRADNRPMLGRFDLESKHYINANLDTKRYEPPERHCTIFGMPVGSSLEKAKKLALRQKMVDSSTLHLIEDNPDWAKYG